MFESSRHGYRVEVPAGWVTNEFDGTWTSLDQFSPGAEVSGEDVVATPDRASFLVMDSMAIPDGMSAQQWLADFNALVAAGLPEGCEVASSSGVIDGEPATVLDQTCADIVIRGHSLVREGRGYYFTTLVPADDPDALAVVQQLTDSIEFVD